MAHAILKTFLSPDIVDYCILPYLNVSEAEVRGNYDTMSQEFVFMIAFMVGVKTADIDYRDDDSVVVLKTLRNKKRGERTSVFDHGYINRC